MCRHYIDFNKKNSCSSRLVANVVISLFGAGMLVSVMPHFIPDFNPHSRNVLALKYLK